jgi:lipopolysaccharide/colanic/teichoic acid biosynthesis glycosyltransferase/glycosyltransferase involved in cell wall biosynthesis
MNSRIPKISVIVPVYNSENTIQSCLMGLLNQSIPSDQYEIIVVDDASEDKTRVIVQSYPNIRYIKISHGGPSAARNEGAKLAIGDFLVFTDADCVPAQDWLYSMTFPFQDPDVVGIKGAYRSQQVGFVPRFVQLEYESKYLRMQKFSSIDFIDTNSAAYRKEIFLENNGFDTNFKVASVEDQEFSFRLARKGYKMVFVPSAIVYHQHDENLQEYFHRKFNIGFWKAHMLHWLPEKVLKDSHTPPSQRWQILFLGIAVLILIPSFFWPPMLWMSVGSLVIFFITAIPFFSLIFRRDKHILFAAPILLILRATALGSGLISGFLFSPTKSTINKTPSIGGWILKRSLDIIISCLGMGLFVLLFPFIALAITIDSHGPILFSQERAGENGRPFKLIKFRTMVDGAEKILFNHINPDDLKEPVYKIPQDPRITRVGKFLRRWSLDEIPQFWNVLRGDMSVVGPRPEETWLVARYNNEQRQRLAVKPGLTGPMQISGRGNLNLSERIELELDYIQDYSLKKDLVILLKSIPAIIRGDGAS